MGDGSAIGGWLLTAAVIAVLAGGVSQRSDEPSTPPTRTPAATGGSTSSAGAGTSDTAAGVPACARGKRELSTDGTRYRIIPVTARGNAYCRLREGSSGEAVIALQRGLVMCSNRNVSVDGAFSSDTRGALRRDQERQLAVPPTGVYGPRTAQVFRWPWYERSTERFTGSCGQLADRTP